MASRRMIDPGFWESETVASWSYFDRLLFIGLFSHADDQGRLIGHPVLVRSKVFPFDDVPMEHIGSALDIFEASESIIRYNAGGKTCIQLVNWWKWQHAQWAWPSKMAPPPGWEDRHCYRKGNVVVKHNWDQADDENEPDESASGATVAPESAHNGTGVSPAPNNRGSNSGSSTIEITPASTLDGAVAAVQVMQDHGMTNAETVLRETDLTPAQLIDTVRYAEANDLGAGWVRSEVRENRAHSPPVEEPAWKALAGDHLCPTCFARPCMCEQFEEVKA